MLDTRRRGFAVMSPDLSGIGFESDDFESCKRYCFNGDVIVEAVPKKCGFSVRLRFNKKFPWFCFKKYRSTYLLKCQFIFGWEWTHEYGREILYTNPDNYTDSVKKNPNLR